MEEPEVIATEPEKNAPETAIPADVISFKNVNIS